LEIRGEWKREVGEKICDFLLGGEGTGGQSIRSPAGAVPIMPVLKRHTKTMKML
jgi:hypothetical protein